jgi:hypothetical protein
MPQCQFPVFCYFLCFKKATQEIFSELDETKAEPPIFPKASQSPKMRWRGPEPGHTLGWRRPGPGRATRGWDQLVHLLTSPFRLYIPLDGKNLNTQSIFQKHIASRRHRRPEIGRIQKLFPAPCRRPSPPPWSPPEWCVSSLPWTMGP